MPIRRSCAVVLALGAMASPAAAVQLVVSGGSSANVQPKDRTSEASIMEAVRASEVRAARRAVREARRISAEASDALGLPRGPLRSAESGAPSPSPFFYWGIGYDEPFCRVETVTRRVRGNDGRIRVVRRRGRVCRVPPRVAAQAHLTFGDPAPSGSHRIDGRATTTARIRVQFAPRDSIATRNRRVRRAILSAQRFAMRRALRSARAKAGGVATEAGLRVDTLRVATHEFNEFSFGLAELTGRYGPGRYCRGVVARVRQRDPVTRRRTGPARQVRRIHCAVPRSVTSSWQLEFASSPLPSD